MKRGRLLKPVLWLTAACIILPAIVLLIWCFAARWPWPGILPESLSLRTVKELIFGSAKLPKQHIAFLRSGGHKHYNRHSHSPGYRAV